MKFAQFLRENDEEQTSLKTVADILKDIGKNIDEKSKNADIYTDGDIYIVDTTKLDSEVTTKEILGYFIYKKASNEGDDFYIGKYIYRVKSNDIDILIDDIKDSFTTIADADLYIKNKLKGNIPK